MTQPIAEAEAGALAAALLARYDAVLGRIDRAVSLILIVTMAVLTAVLCVQVFFRYVLNASLDWGWDVPRLCFIWVVLLAIPLGLKRNAHVGIDLLIEHVPGWSQRALHRFNAALMAALMTVVAYYGVELAVATWDQMMPGLDLSVGYFYVALIISAVHSVLHLVRLLWTGAPPRVEFDVE
ncbi:MAG: TRAP transporter small permease [Proteobacteria bacterium]|nr:TRAP transporter small permease [Pseudomonadota bacterium]